MIGDAVHNLRSALDHIAYTLAVNGYQAQNPGSTIPANHQRRIQFPIVAVSNDPAMTVEQFYAQVIKGQLRYVPAPAAASIESLQPYKRLATTPEADPLWVLHELDIIDKHRKLNPIAVANPIQSLAIGGMGAVSNLNMNWGPVEREREVLRFTLRASGPAPMNVQRQFARYIALNDGPRAGRGEVIAMLRALQAHITDTIVPTLRPHL